MKVLESSEKLNKNDQGSQKSCTQNELRPDIIELADKVLDELRNATTSKEVEEGNKEGSGMPEKNQVLSVNLSDYTESKSINESWRTPRRG